MDYQPRWVAEFQGIARQMRARLPDQVTRIDHIGSTSVVGLAAKDVIDLQLTVTDLTDNSTTATLIELGYQLRADLRFDNLVGLAEDDRELEKHYLAQAPNQREIHIHVREQGRLNQQYPLLFRDYLRADARTRAAYDQVKRELATRFAYDRHAYYAIKDPYMDTIYQAACLWRDANGWQPDNDYL